MSWESQQKARQSSFRERGEADGRLHAPSDEKGQRHGHLLALGDERENLLPCAREDALRFFRERGLHWWSASESRPKGTTYPTRNLCSSQIACVNFLVPLANHPGALLSMLQVLDGDVVGVAPIQHRGRTSRVELEWIGVDRSLEGRKTQGIFTTSADALVVGELSGGGRRAYIFEWKYIERGGTAAKGEGASRAKREKWYAERYERSGLFAVPFEGIMFEPFYQLMRMLLLGDEMVRSRQLGVTDARVVVVCPPGNAAYRKLGRAHAARFRGRTLEDAMRREVLRDPERFQMVSQGQLLTAIGENTTPELAPWIEEHRSRYDWTDASRTTEHSSTTKPSTPTARRRKRSVAVA